MLDLTSPPQQPLVAASILSADFGRIAEECRDVLDQGADLLHVDVMDGHFVPNLTMGVDMIRALRRHLPDACLDVHLMVEKPRMYIEPFAQAGANVFTFHLEVCDPLVPGGERPNELIDMIHHHGMLAGMCINPPTPAEPLEPWLAQLELILVMSVHPGRSGQKFISDVLPKARWLSDRLAPRTRLEMDGGLNPQTAPDAVATGVDTLVSASALFGADDRKAAIDALRSIPLAR